MNTKQMFAHILLVSTLFSAIQSHALVSDLSLEDVIKQQGQAIHKLTAAVASLSQKIDPEPTHNFSFSAIKSLGDAGQWTWENKKSIIFIAGGGLATYGIYSIYQNLIHNVRHEGRMTRSLLRTIKDYLMQLIQTEGQATRKEVRGTSKVLLTGLNEVRKDLAESQGKPAPRPLELPKKQKPQVVQDTTPKEKKLGFFGRMRQAIFG